jgi:hypothetical protein
MALASLAIGCLFVNVVALGVMGAQDQEAGAMWRGGRRGSTTGM